MLAHRCFIILVCSTQTYNVLALVGLVGIALDGLSHTVPALDNVLVVPLLSEAVPLLAVVVAEGALLCPGRLVLLSALRPKYPTTC